MKRTALLLLTVMAACAGGAEKRQPLSPPVIRLNPALRDIGQVYVFVEHGELELERRLNTRELKFKIEKHLKQAGIQTARGPISGEPFRAQRRSVLKVEIDKLKLGNWQGPVYRIKTSLESVTFLKTSPPHMLEVPVWIRCGTINAGNTGQVNPVIGRLAAIHVESFIKDYFSANPDKSRADKPERLSERSKSVTKPAVEKEAAVAIEYLASKNSKRFHLPDCIWTRRISARNLVTYKTLAEAADDGKSPCKTCKPQQPVKEVEK